MAGDNILSFSRCARCSFRAPYSMALKPELPKQQKNEQTVFNVEQDISQQLDREFLYLADMITE